MPSEPETRYVEAENLSEEQVREARRALESLIKIMAKATVDACIEHGIELDMDDPEVARDVMKATFEGLFYPKSATPKAGRKADRRC